MLSTLFRSSDFVECFRIAELNGVNILPKRESYVVLVVVGQRLVW